MITRDLGGNRLGSGGGNEIKMHGYNRSNHDLGYTWKSSTASGTLVPFMSEIGLPGDSFSIDLESEVMTLPTIGPLFGSYKVQLDVFQVPMRLYNKKLKMNAIGIGMNMDKVYLPQLRLKAEGRNAGDNTQVNSSSILSYLNIAGAGNGAGEVAREFNAVDYLAYFDIFKQYYSNKQEDKAFIIHNAQSTNEAEIASIRAYDAGPTYHELYNIAEENDVEIQNVQNNINDLWIRVIFENGNLLPNTVVLRVEYMIGSSTITQDLRLSEYFRVVEGQDEIRYDTPNQYIKNLYSSEGNKLKVLGYIIEEVDYNDLNEPRLYPFDLKNIDEMRDLIMSQNGEIPLVLTESSIEPYCLPLKKGDLGYSILSKQEGLLLKTYQSDLFNNWINTESIDGDNGVNEITRIDTSDGSFTIDTLNLTKKVYEMLSRIGASGGTYDDYLEVIYDHDRFKNVDNPIYMGGLSKELVFEEVISQSQTAEQPLGTLAGRGRMNGKKKGGKIEIKVDEPCVIMGIFSITPRISYSQGNKWDKNLKTIADLHKPHLSGIGFEDLLTDQMAYWDTGIGLDGSVRFNSAGKVPAWINYMTNVDVVKGSFAEENDSMFMVLNRSYEKMEGGVNIKDLTTYIDPSKYNNIFADTRLDAMNFWTMIRVDIFARRKMSEKQIPNL